ncbi:MAG: hypothetical protein EZS28_045929, partial [Streblomastix strix]
IRAFPTSLSVGAPNAERPRARSLV